MMDAGWIYRDQVIWAKKSAMPFSGKDRTTKAHEPVFMFTKKPHYFYDNEAIKEPAKASSLARLGQNVEGQSGSARIPNHRPMKAVRFGGNRAAEYGVRVYSGQEWKPKASAMFKREGGKNVDLEVPGQAAVSHRPNREPVEYNITANKRSVWSLGSAGFKGAHYAVFPMKLVEPMILASTSAHGCCAKCGKPYARVVDSQSVSRDELPLDHPEYRPSRYKRKTGDDQYANGGGQRFARVATTGWRKACKCACEEVRPCVVLDPFGGSGTVATVADFHGRVGVSCDLDRANGLLGLKHLAERQEKLRTKKRGSKARRVEKKVEEGALTLF